MGGHSLSSTKITQKKLLLLISLVIHPIKAKFIKYLLQESVFQAGRLKLNKTAELQTKFI